MLDRDYHVGNRGAVEVFDSSVSSVWQDGGARVMEESERWRCGEIALGRERRLGRRGGRESVTGRCNGVKWLSLELFSETANRGGEVGRGSSINPSLWPRLADGCHVAGVGAGTDTCCVSCGAVRCKVRYLEAGVLETSLGMRSGLPAREQVVQSGAVRCMLQVSSGPTVTVTWMTRSDVDS